MHLLATANLVRWIVSGVLCGGAVAGGVWFILRQNALARGKAWRDAPTKIREVVAKRLGRRRYGAALMILVSALFFVALNFLDPTAGAEPNAALAVWAIVLVLLAILILIAMADVRHTLTDRTLRHAEMNENLIEALARHVREQRKAGKQSDATVPKKSAEEPADRSGGNGQDQ
jgi:amino acid transporter